MRSLWPVIAMYQMNLHNRNRKRIYIYYSYVRSFTSLYAYTYFNPLKIPLMILSTVQSLALALYFQFLTSTKQLQKCRLQLRTVCAYIHSYNTYLG